jgi:hypothetical protein
MFEAARGEKQSNASRLLIVILVVVALGVGGAVMYLTSRSVSKEPTSSAAPAGTAAKGNADPVHDLKVVRATMDKDRTGTTAIWLVEIQNKSNQFAYSDIKYETTYIGADNKALLVNQGTIPANIGPGDQKNSQITDALYPAGTSWYKFRITGATSAAQ